MATQYVDGAILADSFSTQIAGQTYIVNNLSLSVPQVAAERNDEKGALAAKRSEQDLGRISGTCEVQITASAENQRLQFETFVVPGTHSYDGADTTFVVEEESPSILVNESRVRSLSVRRILTQPA